MQTTAPGSARFPAYDPTAQYEVTTTDVEYRRDGDQSWLATIYRPRGAGPFPAVLDVHGGAWTMADRSSNEPMDRPLAASGLVVAAIDFRLAPDHPYPASLADVNYATRWLKAHASEYGADPRHLGGLGTSSGGHQVMLSAMRPRDARYAALPLPDAPDVDASLAYVLACWPILDPFARYFFAQETGRQELVKRTEGYFVTQEAMREGNPQVILDRGEQVELPPALLLQGTADNNLTMAMSLRFVATYRLAGGEAELEQFPDMPHGFGNQPGAESERAIQVMKAFVARQLQSEE
jgi:acetyl esterase/lipase